MFQRLIVTVIKCMQLASYRVNGTAYSYIASLPDQKNKTISAMMIKQISNYLYIKLKAVCLSVILLTWSSQHATIPNLGYVII